MKKLRFKIVNPIYGLKVGEIAVGFSTQGKHGEFYWLIYDEEDFNEKGFIEHKNCHCIPSSYVNVLPTYENLSDLGFEEGANQGWFFKLDKGELWVYPDKIEFLDDDFTTVTLSEYKNIEQVENILKALQI